MRRSRALLIAMLVSLIAGSFVAVGPRLAAAVAASDPVIAAVGDFACDPADPGYLGGFGDVTRCRQLAVSNALLADTSIGAVLGLGDYQYDCGATADWQVSYNPTWGRVDPMMQPVAGNHEYITGYDKYGDQCPASNSTAGNYFTHFGAAAHPETVGHFSFDIGTWHLIGLNAQCSKSGVGGCSATSAQTKWLTQDLAATTQPCIVAFWHQPQFTGGAKNLPIYRPWWTALNSAHADVVLNGHVHNYQRYRALSPSGAPDVNGITEYIVGTGGEAQVAVTSSAVPAPTVSVKDFGYLRMTLQATGWQAEFVDSTGTVRDTSAGTCH